MKEVKVASLDKEDRGGYKELIDEEKELIILAVKFNAKVQTFWNDLGVKHKLDRGEVHYIIDKAIYKQVK